MSKAVLMQGNEAAVEGAIAAGMRVFAGYPITPSTEIAEQSSLRLPQVGGHFIQMEDEISSIAAVLGASAAGVKAMTATSGPGFSLMQENLGYGAMAEIPCVIVDVQRAGPSTGLATSPAQGDYMQARWGTHGDHPVIALSPSSVLETYTLIIRAFNLSEKYRTPVIFLMDEIVGHMREGVELPKPNTLRINQRKMSFHDGANKQCYYVPEGQYVPAMKPFGRGERYNITGLIHDESGFPTNSNEEAEKLIWRLMHKISDNYEDIVRVEQVGMEDADVVIGPIANDTIYDTYGIYADGGGNIHVWLAEGDYIFILGGVPHLAHVTSSGAAAEPWLSGVTANGTDVAYLRDESGKWRYTASNRRLSILSGTSPEDCVTVSGTNLDDFVRVVAMDNVYFAISNLNLHATNAAPISVMDNVTVAIAGDNQLDATAERGSYMPAALQMDVSGTLSLTNLTEDASLVANGGWASTAAPSTPGEATAPPASEADSSPGLPS